MNLKKGWLDRQLNIVATEVKQWPDWMQREASLPRQVETNRSAVSKLNVPSTHTEDRQRSRSKS
jgi:hypothetical protein